MRKTIGIILGVMLFGLLAGAVFHSWARCAVESAVARGDLRTVRFLVLVDRLLVNTSHPDDLSGTPLLSVAIKNKRSRITELLVRCGADVNRADASGATPLHYAAASDDAQVAEMLLARGAENGGSDSVGETPLHYAARDGGAASAAVLLRHGAKADTMNRLALNPLDYALQRGHKGLVEILSSYGAPAVPAIYTAAALGDIERVRIEVRKDHGVVNKPYRGGLPLHYAASNGHLEAVRLLLAEGAPADAKWDQKTALYLAAAGGHTEVARILIEHGADVDSDARGYTPLRRAVMDRNLPLVDLLLAHGADPNKTEPGDLTPLHEAALNGDTAATMALLTHGADASVADYSGSTPLDIAEERLREGRGNAELVRILRSAGSQP